MPLSYSGVIQLAQFKNGSKNHCWIHVFYLYPAFLCYNITFWG